MALLLPPLNLSGAKKLGKRAAKQTIKTFAPFTLPLVGYTSEEERKGFEQIARGLETPQQALYQFSLKPEKGVSEAIRKARIRTKDITAADLTKDIPFQEISLPLTFPGPAGAVSRQVNLSSEQTRNLVNTYLDIFADPLWLTAGALRQIPKTATNRGIAKVASKVLKSGSPVEVVPGFTVVPQNYMHIKKIGGKVSKGRVMRSAIRKLTKELTQHLKNTKVPIRGTKETSMYDILRGRVGQEMVKKAFTLPALKPGEIHMFGGLPLPSKGQWVKLKSGKTGKILKLFTDKSGQKIMKLRIGGKVLQTGIQNIAEMVDKEGKPIPKPPLKPAEPPLRGEIKPVEGIPPAEPAEALKMPSKDIWTGRMASQNIDFDGIKHSETDAQFLYEYAQGKLAEPEMKELGYGKTLLAKAKKAMLKETSRLIRQPQKLKPKSYSSPVSLILHEYGGIKLSDKKLYPELYNKFPGVFKRSAKLSLDQIAKELNTPGGITLGRGDEAFQLNVPDDRNEADFFAEILGSGDINKLKISGEALEKSIIRE
ncbi:MAG: hypothetical protein U9R01_07860, partial [candidate division WOR-3 bacterium]|nr:hypothetical protein [candidate division WOR-3 bacterium]